MRRRLMIWLGILLGIYVMLVFVLYLAQDAMIFPGAGRGVVPVDLPPGARVVELERPGGERFRAVESDGKGAHAVMVFLVGNGEDLRGAAFWAGELQAYGLLVVAPEYPGYGGSAGRPGRDAILATALAAARHARELAKARKLPFCVGGSSLGTFCALHTAAELGADRCLLRAPPTTMAAAAAQRFWWLPVNTLLRQRFDNLAAARRTRCPVLIVHGTADRTVPIALGRELAVALRAAGAPTEMVEVAGADHNNLSLAADGPLGAAVRRFLFGT
jgi:uncharacterized protein